MRTIYYIITKLFSCKKKNKSEEFKAQFRTRKILKNIYKEEKIVKK